MTPKQFADNYCHKEGYKDFADFYMNVPTNENLEKVVTGMMKAYALSVLPANRSGLPNNHPLKEQVDTMNVGWNDCIDQIKKNIG